MRSLFTTIKGTRLAASLLASLGLAAFTLLTHSIGMRVYEIYLLENAAAISASKQVDLRTAKEFAVAYSGALNLMEDVGFYYLVLLTFNFVAVIVALIFAFQFLRNRNTN